MCLLFAIHAYICAIQYIGRTTCTLAAALGWAIGNTQQPVMHGWSGPEPFVAEEVSMTPDEIDRLIIKGMRINVRGRVVGLQVCVIRCTDSRRRMPWVRSLLPSVQPRLLSVVGFNPFCFFDLEPSFQLAFALIVICNRYTCYRMDMRANNGATLIYCGSWSHILAYHSLSRLSFSDIVT